MVQFPVQEDRFGLRPPHVAFTPLATLPWAHPGSLPLPLKSADSGTQSLRQGRVSVGLGRGLSHGAEINADALFKWQQGPRSVVCPGLTTLLPLQSRHECPFIRVLGRLGLTGHRAVSPTQPATHSLAPGHSQHSRTQAALLGVLHGIHPRFPGLDPDTALASAVRPLGKP